MPDQSTMSRLCEWCGQSFSPPPYNARKGFGRFCSVSCGSRSRVTDPVARFWGKVRKTEGCWLWTGATRNGYGVFSIRFERIKAHRFSYAMTFGEIPSGMVVCHRCDNPPCVRPDHLFVGSLSDNAADMAAKGRQVFQTHPERVRRGEANNRARLTREDVIAIRAAYATGETTLAALAEHYSVHLTTIHRVVRRQTWRHLP